MDDIGFTEEEVNSKPVKKGWKKNGKWAPEHKNVVPPTRKELKSAVEDYLKNGGNITKIDSLAEEEERERERLLNSLDVV